MKNKKYLIIITIAIIFLTAGFCIYKVFNLKTDGIIAGFFVYKLPGLKTIGQNDLKIAGEKNLQNSNADNIIKIENNYEINFKNIFHNYLNLADNNKLTADDLKKMQAQVLDLKVPSKYKNLHLEFVFALIKMEKYLETAEIQERDESQRIISKVKADYIWLN